MEKNRPRVIIDRPESMSELRKRTEWSLTAFGWFVWGLLTRPLLIFALWYLGVRQVYVHMVELGGARYLLTFFERYVFVIAAASTILLAWHLYNWLRFRGRDRRRRVADATEEELAQVVAIQPHGLRWLHGCKVITIHFGEEGRLMFQPEGPGPWASWPTISGHYDPAHPRVPPPSK